MMSLPRSCQNEGCKEAGRGKPLPPLVSAPESALGSHSCVALSSAQANARIQQSTRPSGQNSAKLSSRFLRDATILISSRFLLDATGIPRPSTAILFRTNARLWRACAGKIQQ